MSLYFNIRADLTLSYFVILFFNYLQGLHVLPSSIHFVIFKNSFLLNHEDPRDMPHTTIKQHDVYYPSMGVVSACAFSFMSKYLHQSCGPKPMTRVDINDNNQSSNRYLDMFSQWNSNFPF
jgi:hypothetical protein